MPYQGELISQGGVVEKTVILPVNSNTITQLEEMTTTVFVKSLSFSNTSDFASTVTPTAGAVKFEYSFDGVLYRRFQAGNGIRAKDMLMVAPRASGDVNFVRVTTTGIVGANFVRVVYSQMFSFDASIDPRVYFGFQAFTTQSFTEANSKNGNQYEVSGFVASLAAGANVDTIFTTGEWPVIVKSRAVGFNGASLQANVYKNPVFSGGTITPYYNLSDLAPLASDVVIRSGATVTSPGTQFGATTYYIGSATPGSSANVGTFSTQGIERILSPNTTYMLRITNTDMEAQTIASYLTWYAGPLSSDI